MPLHGRNSGAIFFNGNRLQYGATIPISERLNYDRLYQEALSDPELKRTQVELEAALSNSREARQVVFDLFQDLEGFSLDDYKPFSDVSSGLDRLVRFFSASISDRNEKLSKVNDSTYTLLAADGSKRATFSLSREKATSQDDVELIGLDHPLIQKEITRWRDIAPEDVGVCVLGDVERPVLLSLWMVEISTGKLTKNLRSQIFSHIAFIVDLANGARDLC